MEDPASRSPEPHQPADHVVKLFTVCQYNRWGFPESICNAGHWGSITGWWRTSGKGNGNPHQSSCLENSMDRGSCQLQSMGSQRLRFIWSLYLVWGINIILSPPPPKCSSTYLNQSVQPLSCIRLFATPWTAAHQASLSITSSCSLLKLMSIESVMPSNHLIYWAWPCPSEQDPVFPSVSLSHQEASISFLSLSIRG